MSLTTDQVIQVWNAVGTWVAGIATFSAVIVSLRLARNASRVRLKVEAGVRVLAGGGQLIDDLICVMVTNLGERPVTVDNIGWEVGPKKDRKYGLQNFGGPSSAVLPKELKHGERATFTFKDDNGRQWSRWMIEHFFPGDTPIAGLRVSVFTSVGQTVKIVPEKNLLDRLRAYRLGPPYEGREG